VTRAKPKPDLTYAGLVEHAQAELGLGGYDDAQAQPYWRWKYVEAAKLRRLLEREKRSLADAYLAVDYAKATRRTVRSFPALLQQIPAAKRWAAERAAEQLEATYQQAIADADQAGAHDWMERLVRARGPYRAETLAAFRAEHPEGAVSAGLDPAVLEHVARVDAPLRHPKP
jgi:hypothetical protein